MKVKELIQALQQYSPEMDNREVCFSTPDTDYNKVMKVNPSIVDKLIIDIVEE